MQTVNFQCGHCGNLMAVSTEFLGQQVRCPTCQQVVVAPAQGAASPFGSFADPQPEPAPPPPAPTHLVPPSPAPLSFTPQPAEDDIFSAAPPSDDLFGEAPPRLEIPPAPAPAPTHVPDFAAARPGGDPTFPTNGDHAPAYRARPRLRRGGPGAEPAHAPDPLAPAPDTGRRIERKPRSGSSLASLATVLLVIVPLIIYSAMVTAAAVMLYMKQQTAPPNLFDTAPDVTGDNPGVHKGKTRVDLNMSVKSATAKLPDHLVVPLGQTIAVGDLEVTPKRVERRKVAVLVDGFDRPEPCPTDSLVLVLHLKNRSNQWAFTPLDNYFDRKWKPKKSSGSPPLTQLEAGEVRFFGGPASWYPRSTPKEAKRREWVEGRKNFDPDGLAPGEEMETFVCTDGSDPDVALHLFGEDGSRTGKAHSGDLLWRVQLRRGPFNYRGRDIPATSVIGVRFTDRDYNRAG